MNPFTKLFGGVKSLIEKALHLASTSGLTDAIVEKALPLVRLASDKYVDNAERREWVVKALVAQHVPESIARIAVELAYKLYQAELKKLGVK